MCLFAVPCMLAYRLYFWLRYGDGLVMNLEGGRHHQFSWVGVQKIVDWYLQLPIEITLLWAGVLMAFITHDIMKTGRERG